MIETENLYKEISDLHADYRNNFGELPEELEEFIEKLKQQTLSLNQYADAVVSEYGEWLTHSERIIQIMGLPLYENEEERQVRAWLKENYGDRTKH